MKYLNTTNKSDKAHMFDLIEHYKWSIQFTLENKWAVDGLFGSIRGETLNEAIDNALIAQMNWSLGK